MKTFARVAFAFIVMLASTSVYAQQADFLKIDKEINLSINQENWLQVLELAKVQITMDVEQGEGYYYSALALFKTGKSKMAKPYLEQAKKLGSEKLYPKIFELEKAIAINKNKPTKKYENLPEGFIPIRKVDRFFYSYVYNPTAPFGLTVGSINHRGIGTYMTIRGNPDIMVKTGDLTANSLGTVYGEGEFENAETTGYIKHGVVEGIMGITWKIHKPLWMYAGAGLNHSREFWEVEIIDENNPGKRNEWAKNPQANRNQAAIEGGMILDFNGLNLRFGGNLRGFDLTNVEYHLGIGFSLKSK
ncbi:hypothetical protein [Aquiflexum lacus]|uniref:hypothetical protein n=1 Tax=Aquiflexum lacus TaxID=2483805 RepID=UPI0018953F85|nr:hypothetical protein [Aquiflexum lacus]